MNVFQFIGTHPRDLLVNQLQSHEESGIGQAQYLYSLPEEPKLRDLPNDQSRLHQFSKKILPGIFLGHAV